MRAAMEMVDRLLERVPADSVYGRRIRTEVLDHLEEAVSSRVADSGRPLGEVLDNAVTSFGEGGALEHDYYTEYVRSRYALGWIDREVVRHPERLLLRAGLWLLLIGFAFFAVLPTVTTFTRFSTLAAAGAVFVTDATQATPLAIQSLADLDRLAPWWQSSALWTSVLVVGVIAFTAGALRASRRARLIAPAASTSRTALAAMLPLAALGFALTATPAHYSDALSVHLTRFTSWIESSTQLTHATGTVATGFQVGVGLVAIVLAVAVATLLAARKARRSDTVPLRHAAIGVILACVGIGLTSHPTLILAHRRAIASEAAPDPRSLASGLSLDFVAFLVGSLLVVIAIRTIHDAFVEIHRTALARRVEPAP